MTETVRDAEAEATALDASPDPLRRQARTRASSVTPPASIARQAVTDSGRVVRRLLVSGVAALDRPGSLVHSQPPTFRQAWDRHLECARHYEALLFRWPRYVWGFVHVFVIKPMLNFAELVTSSPAWFTVAAAVAAIIWIWS